MVNSTEEARAALSAEPNAAKSPFMDHGWEPPLCVAVRFGCSCEIVDLLLEHRADVHSFNMKGRSPLSILSSSMQRLAGQPVPLFAEMTEGVGVAMPPLPLPPLLPYPSLGPAEIDAMVEASLGGRLRSFTSGSVDSELPAFLRRQQAEDAGGLGVPQGDPQAAFADETVRLHIADRLVCAGADPSIPDNSGRLPFELASAAGRHRLARLCVYWRDKQACLLMFRAAAQGYGLLGCMPEGPMETICLCLLPQSLMPTRKPWERGRARTN